MRKDKMVSVSGNVPVKFLRFYARSLKHERRNENENIDGVNLP